MPTETAELFHLPGVWLVIYCLSSWPCIPAFFCFFPFSTRMFCDSASLQGDVLPGIHFPWAAATSGPGECFCPLGSAPQGHAARSCHLPITLCLATEQRLCALQASPSPREVMCKVHSVPFTQQWYVFCSEEQLWRSKSKNCYYWINIHWEYG